MRIDTPAQLSEQTEKSVRDQFGSVWVDDTYFDVKGDYYEISARPVSVFYYSGAIDMFRDFEATSSGKYLVIESGEFISHVLLDCNGLLWQITTLRNAPRNWTPGTPALSPSAEDELYGMDHS